MSVFNTQKIFTNLIFFTYALSHEIKICWYMEHSEQSRTAYIRLLPIIVIVCVPIIYLYLYLSKMLYFFKIITSINSYSPFNTTNKQHYVFYLTSCIFLSYINLRKKISWRILKGVLCTAIPP